MIEEEGRYEGRRSSEGNFFSSFFFCDVVMAREGGQEGERTGDIRVDVVVLCE